MTQADDLAQARETIRELMAVLEKLQEGPAEHAYVAAATKDEVTLVSSGGARVLPQPPTGRVAEGDVVLVAGSGAIRGRVDALPVGEIAVVTRVVGERTFEIESNGTPRLVLKGKVKELKAGDHVLLGAGGCVALEIVPQARPAYALTAATGVTWADIGGQVEAKAELREAIELPQQNPEVFRAYGHRPAKGILLSGPPGCGKTMLGKAAATAMAGSGVSGFMFVKGPEVLDPYVGVAEANVRSLFARARAHKAEHGTNAVIFIDEAEALLSSRSGRYTQMERTIVPTFLAEMDGVEESGALVILATNKPDALDPAIVRDGRIDRKVRVSRPTKADATHIFELNLRGSPLGASSAADLAAMSAELLYSPNTVLYHIHTKCGAAVPFTMAHVSSGAMIAGIVGRAKAAAMRRDMAASRGTKPSGIQSDDLIEAIESTYASLADLDHDDDIVVAAGGREVAKLVRPESRAA